MQSEELKKESKKSIESEKHILQVTPESKRPSLSIEVMPLERENLSDLDRQNSVCRAKKLKYQPKASIIKEESSRRDKEEFKSEGSFLKSN